MDNSIIVEKAREISQKACLKEDNFEEIELFITKENECSYLLWNQPYFKILILDYLTEEFYYLNTEEFNIQRIETINKVLKIIFILAKNKLVREDLIEGNFEHFIFPFLHAGVNESVKINAIEVFHSIYESGFQISYLIESEILPYTLQIIGDESSKLKICGCKLLLTLFRGQGLDYAVQTVDRFTAIEVVLSPVLIFSIKEENLELLHVLIQIFLRLCEKANARSRISSKTPEIFYSKGLKTICAKNNQLLVDYEKFLKIIKSSN